MSSAVHSDRAKEQIACKVFIQCIKHTAAQFQWGPSHFRFYTFAQKSQRLFAAPGRAGASIPEASVVDGAGRSPCAGCTFTESAIIDPGNTVDLNGQAAIQLPAHF